MNIQAFVILLDAVASAMLLRSFVGGVALAVAGLLLMIADLVMVDYPAVAWLCVGLSLPFLVGFVAELWWAVIYLRITSERVIPVRRAVSIVRESQSVSDSDSDRWEGVGQSSQSMLPSFPVRENMRIVPYQGTFKFTEGVPDEDLIYFAEQMAVRGLGYREWRGHRLPSGRVVRSWEVWRRYIKPFETAGIVSVKPRAPIVVRITDPDRIRELLGLESVFDGTRELGI